MDDLQAIAWSTGQLFSRERMPLAETRVHEALAAAGHAPEDIQTALRDLQRSGYIASKTAGGVAFLYPGLAGFSTPAFEDSLRLDALRRRLSRLEAEAATDAQMAELARLETENQPLNKLEASIAGWRDSANALLSDLAAHHGITVAEALQRFTDGSDELARLLDG